MRQVRVHLADPDFKAGECPVKFTLTYEGQLRLGKHANNRKHAVRQVFAAQIARLWKVHPLLSKWVLHHNEGMEKEYSARKWIKEQIPSFGNLQFVPLVIEQLTVECALEFRVLRPTNVPGEISDIDNQIKFLIDCLQMPNTADEIGSTFDPQAPPEEMDVLLHDDRLVTKISSINDELLQPILGKQSIDSQDVRVLVDVHIRPYMPMPHNLVFFSANERVWDHKYDEHLPNNVSRLTNRELTAVTTQIIYRMRALNDLISMMRSSLFWKSHNNIEEIEGDLISENTIHENMWREDLWPKAQATLWELCKRVYGEPPYPIDEFAIRSGAFAGPRPLLESAATLEALVRQLP